MRRIERDFKDGGCYIHQQINQTWTGDCLRGTVASEFLSKSQDLGRVHLKKITITIIRAINEITTKITGMKISEKSK